MKKLLIALLILVFSFNTTNAWLWLIAQSWDILNVAKWNELVNDKLSRINLKAGSWVTLTTSWNDIFINSASSSIPYISTSTKQLVATSTTSNIFLDWSNFTPTSALLIPWFDWTINSVAINSPTSIQANITTWTTVTDYNLVISNGWTLNTLWPGNWNLLLWVVAPVLWTWLAWTYLEDFEVWLWSYVSSWLTWNWTRDSWGTPSVGTWPNTGAGGSIWYIYTEVSWWANANEFGIETTNFRHATGVSLDYHMFWTDIGTLYIQTLYAWVRTTVWSISWQQQAAQTDPYINTWNIDLTWYQVESIRILMNWAISWAWDTAVDNISITSD